jgi:replicative DNA helicase
MVTLRKTQEEISMRMCASIGNISVHALQRGQLLDDDWGNLTHALGRTNDAKVGFIEQSHIDIIELSINHDITKV